MSDLNLKAICFVIVYCIIYITFQTQIAINHDTIWLVEAANRLVNGADYVERTYETNLPSSIIMHFPVAWLMKAGLDFFTSVYLYAFTVLFCLLGIIYQIVRKYYHELPNYNLAFFIFSTLTLYLQGFYFFERDVIILLLLIPFLLVEYKNFQHPLSKNAFIVPLFLMSIGCLIKPHYAIVPLCIYLIKLFKRRSFTLYHFVIPSLMILFTVSGFWFYYPEFFTVIWPDVKNIYLDLNIGKNGPKIKMFSLFYLSFFISLLPVFFKNRDNHNGLIRFFILSSILYFLPFLLQNKGFNYHILPAIICIITAFFLYLHTLLTRKWIVFFLIGILILSKIYIAYTTRSYEKLQTLPINVMLEKKFDNGSFVILHHSLQYQQYLHAYTDLKSVSRFPSLWCYSLYYPENIKIQKYDPFRQKCYQLAFGDIRNQKPDIIIVPFKKYHEDKNGFFAYALKQRDFKNYLNNNYQLHSTEIVGSKVYNRLEKRYEMSQMVIDIYTKL